MMKSYCLRRLRRLGGDEGRLVGVRFGFGFAKIRLRGVPKRDAVLVYVPTLTKALMGGHKLLNDNGFHLAALAQM